MILDYSTFKPLPVKEPLIVNDEDKMKYRKMAEPFYLGKFDNFV